MSPFTSAKRSRQAFTLIEILVVIAIIAILIALLVPAVQKVRAAAARTQCGNNLKNIGLGCHNYHSSNKILPSGWVTTKGAQPNPGWTWGIAILPFIDQNPLFTTINPDLVTPGGSPGNAPTAPMQTGLAVYLCPADNAVVTNSNFHNNARSNYVCNRWVLGPDSGNLPAAYTIQGIPDGASNTIMIGERDIMFNVSGTAFVRDSNSSACFEGRPGQGLTPQPSPITTPFNTGSVQRLAFSSQHTGGCNFLFADSTVHFLPTNIAADPNDTWTNFPALGAGWQNYTLQLLIIPNDGIPVDIASYQ